MKTIAECKKIVEKHGGTLVVYADGNKWWDWTVEHGEKWESQNALHFKSKRQAANDAAEFAVALLKSKTKRGQAND